MKAYLQLMRPANIITAMADIMAGFAVAVQSGMTLNMDIKGLNLSKIGYTYGIQVSAHYMDLIWLLLSTIGLYGGGVVFNDVFDAELDAVERPERPIPSGRATLRGATTLGIALLLTGIAAACIVSAKSGIIATAIATLALVYDKFGKHHSILGPINMGSCRGGNLLLGMSAAYWAVEQYWFVALIPIIYIAAITTISRGEVHGGSNNALYLAFFLYALVISAVMALTNISNIKFWQVIPFLALFAFLIFPPLWRALQEPKPQNIGKAVKAGIIALIVMDAALAASFAGWVYALCILALLPLSRVLAKKFAVT
jgi:4-hydroxybenzoate polyprenyltransferase